MQLLCLIDGRSFKVQKQTRIFGASALRNCIAPEDGILLVNEGHAQTPMMNSSPDTIRSFD
jgi:hypothetical protein